MTFKKFVLALVLTGFLAVRPGYSVQIDYAANLLIEKSGNSYIVTVDKPCYGADRPYVVALVPRGEEVPDLPPNVPVIPIPMKRLVVGSTPAVACLQALDAMDLLAGLAGGQYLYFEGGRPHNIPEVAGNGGMSRSLDRELLLNLSPDGFLTYVYGDEERRDVDFLSDCGVPVLFMAEYLEDSPLGRAEWIKFIGLLTGREKEADAVFSEVSRRYKELEALASKAGDRPWVLSGAPFGGTWYVPKRDSWPVVLIEAAGGRYLWEDLKGTGIAPLDPEAVVSQASKARFWLGCGTWKSMKDAEASGLPIRSFPPFLSGKIYNNDLKTNEWGGNDYYQSGIVRPDLILADLLWILHPSLVPDHEPVYYRQLP